MKQPIKSIDKSQTDNWKSVSKVAKAALPDHVVKFIEECRAKEHPDSHLIAVLHKVQEHFGYLGASHLDAVAQLMQIPAAKVTGVATFYHYFRLQPKGQFVISVCMGTACYVKGAEQIVQRLRDELGIDFGQTTSDGLFTLEGTRCLGTCGLAPVVMINDQVHAKVTPDQVPALLERYAKQVHRQSVEPKGR
ncbi:MAG: NADH-quinone oxidoreductase subunit NuoE [Phycisphaerae bacterium]|nr:NADH-quinone oxidoreductase subunit NuoE [Phycisphaerae bacterium]